MNRPGIGHVHIVDGTQGPVGKEGPEGKQGERGPIGLTGERGPIGLTGERGPAGEQGPIGPAGRSVQSWTVNGAGHLIVTYSDMTTADLGNVIGPRGPDGPQGVQGIAGPAGRSIYKVEVDSTNHLICTFSDNAVVDLGNVVGPRGPIGDKGEKGTTGATGRPSGLPYIFSTSIGEFDPGVGKLAINSASYTAASKLYVSATTQLGFAAAALLGSWDDATSKVRGILHVFEATNPGNFVAYAIVGSGSDNTGWFTYPVVHIDHGGVLTQDAILAVQFTRAGDKGDTGEKGDKGEQGDLGPTPALTWAFDPSSTDANPGSGKLRLNEPAIPMASVLLISNTEAYGANVAAWIDSLDDSSNTVTRGQLTLIQVDNPGKFAVFNVAGIVTDGSGFRRVPITHIASNGPLAGRVALSFNIAGNKGIDGEGGNVYAPPSGVADGHVALFDHDANHIRSGGPLGTLAFKSKVTGDDMAGKAVTVAQGGTGAATAEDARTNLGLHKVAATGSFKDLLDQPIPFDGQYASLSGRPDLGSASNRNVGIEAGNVPQVTDAGKIEGALVPPPAAGFFGGIKALAAAATKFVTGAGEDGVLTVAQPTFGDIGGTVQANQLPSPTVNDKGGVKALAAVAKKFLTGIGADGVPTAQPHDGGQGRREGACSRRQQVPHGHRHRWHPHGCPARRRGHQRPPGGARRQGDPRHRRAPPAGHPRSGRGCHLHGWRQHRHALGQGAELQVRGPRRGRHARGPERRRLGGRPDHCDRRHRHERTAGHGHRADLLLRGDARYRRGYALAPQQLGLHRLPGQGWRLESPRGRRRSVVDLAAGRPERAHRGPRCRLRRRPRRQGWRHHVWLARTPVQRAVHLAAQPQQHPQAAVAHERRLPALARPEWRG
jgi:hypothetical protein